MTVGRRDGAGGDVAGLLDEDVLRDWLHRAVTALDEARAAIDAVNVFPVPDQDTGTNCLLTLRGALDEVRSLPAGSGTDAVLAGAARGALLSARGNSGMIVSHYLGGLAEAAGLRQPAAGVADLLAAAAAAARGAVLAPQDGTVLTLADLLAAAAHRFDLAGAAPERVLSAALADGHRELGRISEEHPVLRSSRVVDAGALALLVLVDAWSAVADGRATDLGWLPQQPAGTHVEPPEPGWYEVMAVLPVGADDPGPAPVHAALSALGQELAVVDAPGADTGLLRQVHVHCEDPGAVVDALVTLAGPGGLPAAGVQALTASGGPGLVGVLSSAGLAARVAAAGAVVVVAPPGADDPGGLAALAVRRAVRDAGRGGVAVALVHAPTRVALPDGVPTLAAQDEDDVLVAVTMLAAGADVAAAREALGVPVVGERVAR